MPTAPARRYRGRSPTTADRAKCPRYIRVAKSGGGRERGCRILRAALLGRRGASLGPISAGNRPHLKRIRSRGWRVFLFSRTPSKDCAPTRRTLHNRGGRASGRRRVGAGRRYAVSRPSLSTRPVDERIGLASGRFASGNSAMGLRGPRPSARTATPHQIASPRRLAAEGARRRNSTGRKLVLRRFEIPRYRAP